MNVNKILLLLGLATTLFIQGCSNNTTKNKTAKVNTEQLDLAALQTKINEVSEDDFGEFMVEMHRSEQHYDHAQLIHNNLVMNELPAKTQSAKNYYQQGNKAAAKAMHHRENAESAFGRILEVLETTSLFSDNSERLTYLESLHLEEGVEIPTLPVYFSFSQSQLNRSEETKVENLVKLLSEYPVFSLKLIAYADTVGSAKRNFQLAEARNYMVLRALHKYGLPVNTVISVTVGEADGPDETRNPQNRRVEIVPYVHGKIPQYDVQLLDDEAEGSAEIEFATGEDEENNDDEEEE